MQIRSILIAVLIIFSLEKTNKVSASRRVTPKGEKKISFPIDGVASANPQNIGIIAKNQQTNDSQHPAGYSTFSFNKNPKIVPVKKNTGDKKIFDPTDHFVKYPTVQIGGLIPEQKQKTIPTVSSQIVPQKQIDFMIGGQGSESSILSSSLSPEQEKLMEIMKVFLSNEKSKSFFEEGFTDFVVSDDRISPVIVYVEDEKVTRSSQITSIRKVMAGKKHYLLVAASDLQFTLILSYLHIMKRPPVMIIADIDIYNTYLGDNKDNLLVESTRNIAKIISSKISDLLSKVESLDQSDHKMSKEILEAFIAERSFKSDIVVYVSGRELGNHAGIVNIGKYPKRSVLSAEMEKRIPGLIKKLKK